MKYIDKLVSVTVENDTVTVEAPDKKLILTKDEAKDLLTAWEPQMSSRGNFLMVSNGGCFRSHDVRSIVRCLRKVFK